MPLGVAKQAVAKTLIPHPAYPQARRVFEILQLRFLDQTDAAAKTRYRLAIKKRLCQPHLVRTARAALRKLARPPSFVISLFIEAINLICAGFTCPVWRLTAEKQI